MQNPEMTKFVIKVGILKWGLSMYLFISGLQIFRSYKTAGHWDKDISLAGYLLLGLVIWFLAGVAFGVLVWKKQKQ